MAKEPWNDQQKLIDQIRVSGPGAATRTAVAGAATQAEDLIVKIHAAGPNRLAPKCVACLGKTTACGPDCGDECPYSTNNTIRKIDELFTGRVDAPTDEERRRRALKGFSKWLADQRAELRP